MGNRTGLSGPPPAPARGRVGSRTSLSGPPPAPARARGGGPRSVDPATAQQRDQPGEDGGEEDQRQQRRAEPGKWAAAVSGDPVGARGGQQREEDEDEVGRHHGCRLGERRGGGAYQLTAARFPGVPSYLGAPRPGGGRPSSSPLSPLSSLASRLWTIWVTSTSALRILPRHRSSS